MPKQTVGSRIAGVNTGINLGPYSFGGKVYYLDPVDGLDGNDGRSPETAVKTLEVGYGKLRDGENDCLVFVAGGTAVNITSDTGLTWSKNYAHLIGGSADLPGVGQRCRIIAPASLDATYVLTISGDGCVFKNLNIQQENDAAEDSWAVYVTGDRNYFENVFFNGMLSATAAARTGSGSLKIVASDGENYFKNCTIGTNHQARTAANADLYLKAPSCEFDHCKFLASTAGSGTGHFFINVAGSASGEEPDYSIFRSCLFINNYSVTMTDAITKTATGTHWMFMQNCMGEGFTGWTDTVTMIYSADPAPNNGFGLGLNPAA